MEKNKANDLLIRFMNERGLNEVEIATAIGKNPSTIYRITAKTVIPSRTTLKLIADTYRFDANYFKTGKMQEVAIKSTSDSPWKDEAYARLKSDMDYLKGNYDKLLNALLNSKDLGKLKSFRLAGFKKRNHQKVRV